MLPVTRQHMPWMLTISAQPGRTRM